MNVDATPQQPPRGPHLVVRLREEVRMAGEAAYMLRVAVGMIIAFPLLGALALAALTGPSRYLLAALVPVAVTVAITGAFASALALLYRTCRRCGFRRQLAQRSAMERAAILLPLRKDRWSDTRKLARSLIGELGVPSEISPAAPAEDRGDEPSPADL